jgi:hypothetical protein
MADIRTVLAQAAGITKKNMAVLLQEGSFAYPEGFDAGISYEEAVKRPGSNYKGFNIYEAEAAGSRFFLCMPSDSYYQSEAIGLLMLLLGTAIEAEASAEAYLRKALEGSYDAAGMTKLEEKLEHCLPGYVLLIDGFGDFRAEVREILINTMDTKICMEYDNRIMAVADAENIAEACSSFIKNVLSELFIECRLAIGGRAMCVKELHGLYLDCIEALCLKQIYRLGDSILNYEDMYGYRIAHALDPKLKEFISRKVFNPEFREMLNGELGTTIEEFFRNNLNLTDTAAKLYIHRNTLLYRLDKIYKTTGFDLKRFEDSWLFKLAWIINKEEKV